MNIIKRMSCLRCGSHCRLVRAVEPVEVDLHVLDGELELLELARLGLEVAGKHGSIGEAASEPRRCFRVSFA